MAKTLRKATLLTISMEPEDEARLLDLAEAHKALTSKSRLASMAFKFGLEKVAELYPPQPKATQSH